MSTKKYSFIYKNSLSIVFILLFAISLIGQIYTGWQEYNNFLTDHHQASSALSQYLSSGHFLQATFENWESEFLQMAIFVLFTVSLRQVGSSESKKLGVKEEVDRQPKYHKGSPWPVKKGGFILTLYKHSLSISLLILFIFSFLLHFYGSYRDFNEVQSLEGKATEDLATYRTNSRFWFESFQNWQSEFMSIFAIIFLSIYLREFGSPQSKPVDAPHIETGE
ncbi:MAG: DUF6766 family protein [Saprospiraceae bacterium]